jgi:hypothetical protein
MNFWDSRAKLIAMINDLKTFAPEAFQHEVLTRIPNSWNRRRIDDGAVRAGNGVNVG